MASAALGISATEKKRADARIWSMALPVMVDNVFQQLGGFAVMAMIGHVSVLATGAIGLAVRITSIVWALFRGITTAVTVYVSQSFGADSGDRMRSVAVQSVYLTTIISTALSLAIWLFADTFLLVFDPGEEIFAVALAYIRIVCWGIPFISIMQVCGGIMQGAGNARRPMVVTLLLNASILLIALPLFAFGTPQLMEAVIHAGVATVASQALAALFSLYSVFVSKSQVPKMARLERLPAVDGRMFQAIFRVGLPASAEYLFWQLAAIVVSRIILRFGETSMGAYQLGLQMEALSYMPAAGLSVAITSLVGHAIGAGERDLARHYFVRILSYMFVITSAVSLLFLLGNAFLMGLMTDDPAAIGLGAIYLFLMGLVQLPQNLSNALFGAMRGAGHTKPPMFIAMTGLWGIRVPVSIALSFLPGIGVVAIWSVMCVDLVIRFSIALVTFKRMDIFGSKALSL